MPPKIDSIAGKLFIESVVDGVNNLDDTAFLQMHGREK